MNYSGGPPARTHKTAVVLIPPQGVWPPIQAIRRVHDWHFRRWMPHITLVYPFRPKSIFAALIEPLTAACSEHSPFEVELATLRSFRHRSSYTVWLAPEPREALVRLQMALGLIVPDCEKVRRHAGGFTPHLSVGQVRGRGALSELLAELQAGWTPIRFQASEISLIWRNDPPDDVFRVGQSVKLGGANP